MSAQKKVLRTPAVSGWIETAKTLVYAGLIALGVRTIAVKAAPAAVSPADLDKMIYEILEIAETELRDASLDDLRRSICASLSCRAAIKINTRLDTSKMEWLLRALAATDCPMSCPHGRPIAMHYSTREILKAFHRI